MEIKQIIAHWVKQARTEMGLTGAQLGARIAIELKSDRGNTRANISHWETGKHEPSIQQLLAIAKITGKSLPPSITDMMQVNPGPAVSAPDTTQLQRLNADDARLLEAYRLAPTIVQDSIKRMLESIPKIESPDQLQISRKS
jgi:transcriptional regulator with XRE-family HTH domain